MSRIAIVIQYIPRAVLPGLYSMQDQAISVSSTPSVPELRPTRLIKRLCGLVVRVPGYRSRGLG
jgi:hypothetical protein